MRIQSNYLVAVSFLASALMAGGAVAQHPILPTASTDGFRIRGYDKDGRLGMFQFPQELNQRTATRVVLAGGEYPDEWKWNDYVLTGGQGPWLGPMVGFHTSDFSESFVSWTDTGSKGPVITVPVSSIDLGLPDMALVNDGTPGIVITELLFMESVDSPASTRLPYLPDSDPCFQTIELSVEFLPGNSLYGQQSHQGFYIGSFCDSITPGFYWSDEPIGGNEFTGWLGEVAPEGPVRITAHYYSMNSPIPEDNCSFSDTIDVNWSAESTLNWVAATAHVGLLCSALEQNAPAEPIVSPLQKREILLAAMNGTFNNFTNIAPFMDRTGDDAWDVADMIKWTGN